MPLAVFNGRIIVINTEEEAIKAIEYLKTFNIVGIDTETKPSFKKKQINKVALLQISTNDTCFLFRLKYIGMPDSIIEYLSNTTQLKVGLSLKDDIRVLNNRHKMTFGKYIDLQEYVTNFGITDKSLQKIYALLFHEHISKRQRLSNWEADVLTDAQKKYASLDAWACLRIYTTLSKA
ncbi:MAG: 3'-5' exonuclease domain-containing protein 2 [Prevotellaceae bacterium]|nr:3'-5' exonuclease domain-containing protein 2 [Candidatus Faecinaster equi]